ncbi:MAG: acetyl-CoA carboxylase, carboxyltransferase subunit beta [Vulcanimicrobiota bacterium]
MAGLFDKLRSHRPRVEPPQEGPQRTGAAPTDLWMKCRECSAVLYRKNFVENLKVCEQCGHHEKMTARERLASLADPDSFQEWDKGLLAEDPLEFGEEYRAKLVADREKTGLDDAILTGKITLDGMPIALGIMDFHFRGGSMGSVVGEKICRLLERAAQEQMPAVVVTCSGGARMQEGMLSLMQMARTSAAVRRLAAANQPYFVILTDPTTAGVAASFASLGDVIMAEPKAIIGFSGARVIEQTIRQKLPPGFQTSEFYQKHGFIDSVVPRPELRQALIRLVAYFVRPVVKA